ncbi:LCP family protein [Ornithinimicrobium sp. W1679]|uniref:LCP family protein n=1 Tax=Ornithinimicrobium sp. W1679 TaxID=3418770 RepID=UPI003CEC036C
MPHRPEDDWTRPVPRRPRPGRRPGDRAGWDGTDGGYDDGYRGHDDGYRGYDDGNQRGDQGYDDVGDDRTRPVPRQDPPRGHYDENGDWVPRPRPRDDDRQFGRREGRERPLPAAAPSGPAGRGPGRPAAGPPPPRPPRRRRGPRYGLRRLGVILTLAVAAYVVSMVAVLALLWNGLVRVDATPDTDRPTTSPGATYLLVGTDSREQLSDEQRGEFGTGSAEGSRADTVMLLHVPTMGEPTLVSLPRDSFVTIRDHGLDKLNAAHARGGAELLVDTVEQATGLRLDGYLEIGFGGFVGVVEEVGGVRMCLDAPIQDERAHIDLAAGCQELTGPEALGYVRMRYSDPRGDIGRVERQREFLAALVSRMASPATVLNPVRLFDVGSATGDAVAVGEDTNVVEAARMALAMRQIASGSGVSVTVPVADANYQTTVGSAVLWDEQRADELFAALRRGESVSIEP